MFSFIRITDIGSIKVKKKTIVEVRSQARIVVNMLKNLHQNNVDSVSQSGAEIEMCPKSVLSCR